MGARAQLIGFYPMSMHRGRVSGSSPEMFDPTIVKSQKTYILLLIIDLDLPHVLVSISINVVMNNQ